MNENPFLQSSECEARPSATKEALLKRNEILAKKAILLNSTQATKLAFKQLTACRSQYYALQQAIESTQEAIKSIRSERQTTIGKYSSFEGFINAFSNITSNENITKSICKDKIVEQRKGYLELCESEKKELKRKIIEYQFLKENQETIEKEIEVYPLPRQN